MKCTENRHQKQDWWTPTLKQKEVEVEMGVEAGKLKASRAKPLILRGVTEGDHPVI